MPSSPGWQVWVDTGGTFTDCVALDPRGQIRRAKVLSSSALRGQVWPLAPSRVRFESELELPDGFFSGATLKLLAGGAARITGSVGASGELRLESELSDLLGGEPGEVVFDEEAPVLAARVVTSTAAGDPLPTLALRLGTTRGTNALLERRGPAVALFVTTGFRDLLSIGTQQRDDLFALAIEKQAPLCSTVIEVEERLAADGSVVRPLELESLRDPAAELLSAGVDCAAIALLHSYCNPAHEQAVAALLRAMGFRHVSASCELAARIEILPRAETAVVNAYLSPAIASYLEGVQAAIGTGTLHVMTSAGGLIGAAQYEPKDSLLSGPAGGVVGAASAGRASGERSLIAFDMGGTSTDVSRIGERLDYRHRIEVGGVRLMAPALAIETVAAGGGSICWFDGAQVRVGPQSAGASPGPASYGRGGPLTLTDVNLLLGRIEPSRFAIPLDSGAAQAAAGALLAAVREGTGGHLAQDALLTGLLAIADERMAEAIRRISIRQGYDLAEHALVAFGGAGAQHACALAEILGLAKIVIPADAGILSALGLGAARLERFAERSVLASLSNVGSQLAGWFSELADEARSRVAAEGVAVESIVVSGSSAELRIVGQEATLTVEWEGSGGAAMLARDFEQRYRALYGYAPPSTAVEVESLRLVAATRTEEPGEAAPASSLHEAPASGRARAWLGGSWGPWPVYERSEMELGAAFTGPALVWEAHSATVVETGWKAHVDGAGALALCRSEGES